MTEADDMYSSHEYKMLREACNAGNEKEIRDWYTEIQKGYGHGMMNEEIGTVDYLISIYCK